jgi:hypothetical protein
VSFTTLISVSDKDLANSLMLACAGHRLLPRESQSPESFWRVVYHTQAEPSAADVKIA